jgi:hypothetical protein
MRLLLAIGFAACLLLFSGVVLAENGVVVVGERGCKQRDLIIISTAMGFVAAEVYTGFFDKGDQVTGDLNSYGLFDVSVNGSSGSIYIDDYFMSKSRAAEKCFKN